MKIFRLLITIFLGLLLISAMTYGRDLWKESRSFSNFDGSLRVEAPANWKVMDLNEEAHIEIGDADKEAYLIVIPESKEDLHGWNIDKHSAITLGNLLYLVDFPQVVGPKYLEINGNRSIQYEVHGANQGLNISYILTTIETAENFHQVLAWSLKSRFRKNKNTLEKAIESFQEVPLNAESKQILIEDGSEILVRL